MWLGEQQPARGENHEKVLHPEERRLYFVQQAVQGNQVLKERKNMKKKISSFFSWFPFKCSLSQGDCEKDQGPGSCIPAQVGRLFNLRC